MPWRSVSLILTATAAAAQYCPAAAEWLQYDRAAIAAGQAWRVVTCHLTHWSLDHFLWDAAALAALGLACEAHSRRATLGCLIIAAVWIPFSVAWLMPEMETYRGLSGIDSALFALLAGLMLRRARATANYAALGAVALALAAFAAKTAFEFLAGDSLFVDSAAATMVPLPLVHVVGGIVGLAIATLPGVVGEDRIDLGLRGVTAHARG